MNQETCNGYFDEPPVQVVLLRLSVTLSKKRAIKEMKGEPGDTVMVTSVNLQCKW